MVVGAADLIGVRGVLVQALSVEAMAFHEHIGFTPSAHNPMLLMVTLGDLRAGL